MRQTGRENGEIYGTPATGKPSEERNVNKVRDMKVHRCKEPWVKTAQTA